jgi:hypothetical protein
VKAIVINFLAEVIHNLLLPSGARFFHAGSGLNGPPLAQWLKFYGFATRRAPDADAWFWGTGRLMDGWLAFAALVVVLTGLALWRRNHARRPVPV